MGLGAARDVLGPERQGRRGSLGHALLEQALLPALRVHPVVGGHGCQHQEDGQEAAGEGDHLQLEKNPKRACLKHTDKIRLCCHFSQLDPLLVYCLPLRRTSLIHISALEIDCFFVLIF